MTTDAQGEAIIPETLTREIRLFPGAGDDFAIGKMVVIENPLTVITNKLFNFFYY